MIEGEDLRAVAPQGTSVTLWCLLQSLFDGVEIVVAIVAEVLDFFDFLESFPGSVLLEMTPLLSGFGSH